MVDEEIEIGTEEEPTENAAVKEPEAEVPEDENKYKFSFLQIEKRLVNLEIAIGELSEKIKKVDVKSLSGIQEKVDELEDFLLVENAGVVELKKIMEKIEKGVDIKSLPSQDVINKIVSEVADLRSELNKEIVYLKEKVEGEEATKSDIDIKFLSSRVKSLKENVDFLVNRKVEIDQKIQSMEKEIANIRGMSQEIAPGQFKPIDNDALLKLSSRVDNLEKSAAAITERIGETIDLLENMKGIAKETGGLQVSENIEGRVKNLEERIGDVEKSGGKGIADLDVIIGKIMQLESRIAALEKLLVSGKHPIVLE